MFMISLGIMVSATACTWLAESKYSNCVVARDVGSFTGEKLKNDGNAISSRELTETCIAKDKEIEDGDGADRGKVRWVVCLQGPDCDEAGMF